MTESDCTSANALATSEATSQEDQLMVLDLILFDIFDENGTYYMVVTFVVKGGRCAEIEERKKRDVGTTTM
jgi:hypothetical protein